MQAIPIIALLGAIGYLAYKFITRKEIITEREPEGGTEEALAAADQLLETGGKLAANIINTVEGAITDIVEFAETDVPEFFGFEGFDTLKKDAKMFHQMFLYKKENDLQSPDTTMFKHLFDNCTYKNPAPMLRQNYQLFWEDKFQLREIYRSMVEQMKSLEPSVTSSFGLPPSGDYYYVENDFDGYYPQGLRPDSFWGQMAGAISEGLGGGSTIQSFEEKMISFRSQHIRLETIDWSPGRDWMRQWGPNYRKFAPHQDTYNKIHAFMSCDLKPPTWEGTIYFHSLIPAHTYIYVGCIGMHNNVAKSVYEYRFRDFRIEDRAKILLHCLFSKTKDAFEAFYHKASKYGGNIWTRE